MGQRATDRGDVTDPDIGQRQQRLGDERGVGTNVFGLFKIRERRHCADRQATGVGCYRSVFAFDFSQAHKLRRAEDPSRPHQPQGSAAGNGPDRLIVGIKQLDRLGKRRGLGELKLYHWAIRVTSNWASKTVCRPALENRDSSPKSTWLFKLIERR